VKVNFCADYCFVVFWTHWSVVFRAQNAIALNFINLIVPQNIPFFSTISEQKFRILSLSSLT
jgi:hypothetical protein